MEALIKIYKRIDYWKWPRDVYLYYVIRNRTQFPSPFPGHYDASFERKTQQFRKELQKLKNGNKSTPKT